MHTVDQDSVKLGLLIEAAQTHQRLAEGAIARLNEHTQVFEAAVREQVHSGLREGLRSLHAETQNAVEALRRVKRAANARVTLWTLGLTAISAGIALFVAWSVLPTPAEIAAL